MPIVVESKPVRCCARCGLTPYEVRRDKLKGCWSPAFPVTYPTHIWIQWAPREEPQ